MLTGGRKNANCKSETTLIEEKMRTGQIENVMMMMMNNAKGENNMAANEANTAVEATR